MVYFECRLLDDYYTNNNLMIILRALRIVGFWLIGMMIFVASMSFFGTNDASAWDYDFPYQSWGSTVTGEDSVDFGVIINNQDIERADGITNQLQEEFNVQFDDGDDPNQRATNFVTQAVNWVLWITGLISLAVVIYGFYQMFVSGDDEEAFGRAKKIMIYALLALLIIWFAWLITSQLFDVLLDIQEQI